MKYTRNCPRCGNAIEYKNPKSFKKACNENKPCRPCYSKKIGKTLKRRHRLGEITSVARNRKREAKLERGWTRECPECGNTMAYSTEKLLKRAIRDNTICNSCSTYKYKKNWKHVITEDHIKQMRATKAGFQDWDEYLEKYPEKELYKREVWRLTYQNPLDTLENWNKRGRCGVEGAYQLDHIVSINEGWENQIPPEEIANWNNLRMIPWAENREKW